VPDHAPLVLTVGDEQLTTASPRKSHTEAMRRELKDGGRLPAMTVLRSIAVFLLAALAEIGGA
jgi:hypothetical protein